MSKGTPSMGKRGKRHTHIKCPRCGNDSYHSRDKICASCGFGRSKKRNN
ncbi:MAG: 50S ribosomal protein L37e [Candidatus Altiarchaeota archaeon]|nr:50S ribosomal protein L37e [Candidatus Altiarchaeota archaeon]